MLEAVAEWLVPPGFESLLVTCSICSKITIRVSGHSCLHCSRKRLTLQLGTTETSHRGVHNVKWHLLLKILY